jgi:hypothetical protein
VDLDVEAVFGAEDPVDDGEFDAGVGEVGEGGAVEADLLAGRRSGP